MTKTEKWLPKGKHPEGEIKDWDIEQGFYCPTLEDLKYVMAGNPDLCCWGLLDDETKKDVPKRTKETATFESLREKLKEPEFVEMFKFCCWWLSMLDRAENPTWDTYRMKCAVENHYGKYVMSGTLIAAILYMGFKYRRNSKVDGEGLDVAIKRKGSFYKYTTCLRKGDNSRNIEWLNKSEGWIVLNYFNDLDKFTYPYDGKLGKDQIREIEKESATSVSPP